MGCGGPGEGGWKTTPPEPLTFAQAGTPESPGVVLDELDARAPIPLLPMMANHQKENMRDHLVAVQEIVAALASNDFAAIEQSEAHALAITSLLALAGLRRRRASRG